MTYADTSALAKWYLPEARSEDFANWIVEEPDVWISTLTTVEMHSLLRRRAREGELTVQQLESITTTLTSDLNQGFLLLQPIRNSTVADAAVLLKELPQLPLRTLDAIHLSVMRDMSATSLATADATQASAARALGVEIVWFGEQR